MNFERDYDFNKRVMSLRKDFMKNVVPILVKRRKCQTKSEVRKWKDNRAKRRLMRVKIRRQKASEKYKQKQRRK